MQSARARAWARTFHWSDSRRRRPEYATTQTKLRDGIAGFIEDAGYAADVEHVKVCTDCNRNESDEWDSTAGLNLVKRELYAGRPVIMGLDVVRAMKTTGELHADDGSIYEPYTGELSNGDAGWIDHYALITGYRNIDGKDVVFLNLGWQPDDEGEPWVDIPFVWNPGGKWLHLYSVAITTPPDGKDWCGLDRGIGATFLADNDLDPSFETVDANDDGTLDTPLAVVAGESCGVMRQRDEYQYDYTAQSDTAIDCDPRPELENGIDQALEETGFGSLSSDSPDGLSRNVGGGPIVEWIPPPGL